MSKFLRRIRKAFGSKRSVDSGYNDIQDGLEMVINSGTATFISRIGITLQKDLVKVKVGKKQTTPKRNSDSGSSTSSSSSHSSGVGVEDDCVDGVPITEVNGAKVTEVVRATYAHGLGLRDNDIIISVNGNPVDSVAKVASMIQMIIKSSQNSKLRMEIHRREKGLIILDNGGEDVCAFDDNELIRIDQTKSKLKNVRFERYLYAKSSKLRLSNFRTPLKKKYFTIRHYAKVVGDGNEKFIALQHNKTMKWVHIENGKVTLQRPPSGDGFTLPKDSNYLIQLTASGADEILQPVNETGKAIGFETATRRATAILLPVGNEKVFFKIFSADSH